MVEIDHELDVVTGGGAHRLDRREIIAEPLPAEAELKSGEPSLLREQPGLITEPRRISQPKPIGVVGWNRSDRAAEMHSERYTRQLRAGIPDRHVDARDRDQGHALQADQVQRLAPGLVSVESGERFAIERASEVITACARDGAR